MEPVPVTGAGRSLIVVAWLVLAALLLLVLKPWQSSGVGGGIETGRPLATRTPEVEPSPTAPDQCIFTAGWRIYTVEIVGPTRVETWIGIHPAVAAGPDEASIPLVNVFTRGITGLGYCAPLSGPERPPGIPVVTLWRLFHTGSAVTAEKLTPPLLGGVSRDPFTTGAAYRPPGPDSVAAIWPASVYVFQFTAGDGAWERWMAADVQLVSTPPPTSPSP